MKPKRSALFAEKEENPATEAETVRTTGDSGVFRGAIGCLVWLWGATGMCSSFSHFRGMFTIPAQPPPSQSRTPGHQKGPKSMGLPRPRKQ